jgi:hypothetical protein
MNDHYESLKIETESPTNSKINNCKLNNDTSNTNNEIKKYVGHVSSSLEIERILPFTIKNLDTGEMTYENPYFI